MAEKLPQTPYAKIDPAKFKDQRRTATGEPRAHVALRRLDTLWFNTGTLCNITCRNCYIESSPRNDRLEYLALDDIRPYLDEIERDGLGTREIGFTGGEPFMNPHIFALLDECLARGFRILVLTNAMRPMQRHKAKLLDLERRHGDRLAIRVSLDHFTAEHHEEERGADTFASTRDGLVWLARNGFNLAVAGRTMWGEDDAVERAGFARLFAEHAIPIDAYDPAALVLFPEMDAGADVPEISEACWGILGKSPDDVMCASSRMVVKRKGAEGASVLACTLIPYDRTFELGTTLRQAARAVPLNHPHCAKFCVLGGASCSRAAPRDAAAALHAAE
ncbi:MAG TPA: radical SAM protein [Xanthobacteraceae bacterium]|nr:radical SAM protein [Xanthobacteraceae bacterium]